MRLRYLALLSLLLACAACGGPAGELAARNASGGFELRVLPDSFAPGGSADVAVSTRELPDGLVEASITAANADGLRAFYCDLDYNASRYAPLSAAATDALAASAPAGGDPGELALQLAVLDDPGTVHLGQVLVHPQDQAGLSGSAVLATVRFAPVGIAPSRGVSLAPVTDASETVLSYDGTSALHWGYYSSGDYDQNSQTNIADLTPVGVHFTETTGGGPFSPDTVQAVVDGDGNGEINISDLTPIGVNFNRHVDSYNVYASASASDYPTTNASTSTLTPIGTVPYSAHTGASTTSRLQFSLALSYDTGLNYWVRPAEGPSEGTSSNMLPSVATGNPPVINSMVAGAPSIASSTSTSITVDATDADGDTLNYNYSTTAGTISGTGSAVTFNAPPTGVDLTVTIGVTVDDGHGNIDTDSVDVQVTGDTSVVSEIHIFQAPAPGQGTGTLADPFGLDPSQAYTFTALDEDSNDVTAEVTFESIAETGQPPLPTGVWTLNSFDPEDDFAPLFYVIGHYHQGLPDQIDSNPDLVGQERHFYIQNLPPT